MSLKSLFVVSILWFFIYPLPTPWALELISPRQDTVVHPGETIMIKVKPSPGEDNILMVYFDGLFGGKVKTPPYEYQYKVGPRTLGRITVDIFTIVPDPADPDGGQIGSEIELHLLSVLPPTTVLTGIRVDSDQRTLFMRVESKRSIDVYGQFSDGVERDVTFAGMGTTYSSSDEKVATVNADGLVTATGVGVAQITIKNGEHKLTIEAEVKPKKK